MISKTECDIHKGQQLTAICIDQYCSNHTACCQICIENLHNVHDHKVVALSSIQSFISNKEIIDKQNQECYSMKKEFIAVKLLLSDLAELVDEKIEFLSKNQLNQDLTLESLFGENTHQLHILKVYLQQYHIKNNAIANLNEELKEKMEYQIKQQVSFIHNFTIEYTKKIRKLLQKLSIDQFKEDLKYSETNKHKYIQIKESKNAILTQQIGYGVIYGEQGFDPSKESFHCSFLINNLSYGLVGFGQIEASKPMHFQIYDFSLGHGFYVLHNTGIIYNSDDNNNNNVKQKALAFDKNDTVICQYEAQTKQFTFFKESNKNEKYVMKLTNTCRLYPVAILFGPGDSISFQ